MYCFPALSLTISFNESKHFSGNRHLKKTSRVKWIEENRGFSNNYLSFICLLNFLPLHFSGTHVRTMHTRADKGWAVKRALRSSFNVWCGVEIFLFANRKSYFLSVISGYNVKYINLFLNNINKQFHMLIFVCLKVKLVGRVMPKFEFNLKVLNASSFR